MATRCSKRKGKAVTSEVETEEQTETVSSSETIVTTEEDAPKEDQDQQDSQMDIEVQGSTSTVTVSWDKKNEEGEVDVTEKRTNADDQMMDSAAPEEQTVSSSDAVGSTEDAPSASADTKMKQEIQESGESQMDIVAGSTASVTVTREEKNEEGENNDVKKETNGGFCLFVGNLKTSQTSDEVKESLTDYFTKQSLQVQGIRLGKLRRHAFVDLASEMDVTKGLALNGEVLLEKPLKIAKAKVISEGKVKIAKAKVKTPAEGKKGEGKRKASSADQTLLSKKAKLINDGFCLFVGNLNNSKTSDEIKASLTDYFTKQSLQVQDIRLAKLRRHAFVGLASEMEVTKGLTLNGEVLLEKPMKIGKAKVISEDKVKTPAEGKKGEGKRKAPSNDETSPPKKAKLINDGFCLFVGNLKNSNTFDEVKDSLSNYFTKQSVQVQGIRLAQSRKYAFVDLASENDVTKGLTLNGEMLYNKRMKIAKARVISEDQVTTPPEDKKVKGKQKAGSADQTSPSKKAKHLNDGFCLFVGNLNNSKTFDEVKDSLSNYFMKQSLLVQDIRLAQSRKHAFIDLASEMDVTKGLTLNGEVLLEKPMKIAKAKVISEGKVKIAKAKVKTPAEIKQAEDSKCLFLKNVPNDATKEHILKVFCNAVSVRFPGGTEGPEKGIAFVEFNNETTAKEEQQQKQGVKIQGRSLIVDFVGDASVHKVTKAKPKAAAPQKNTLLVSSLPPEIKEEDLKKIFQNAVSISVPTDESKSRGTALIEFAAAADAKKAFHSCQNKKVFKKAVKVQYCNKQANSEQENVPSKTLFVMGLAEKTSVETLKSAFEGALSARVTADKKTGVSRRFGFVDFETEDDCKAVKEAMEDCEIDGSKVIVAYAKDKGAQRQPRPAKPSPACGGQPAGQGGGKRGKGSKRGKGRGAGTPKVQDAV